MKSIVIAIPQTTDGYKPPLSARVKLFLRQYGASLFLLIILLSGVVAGAVRATAQQGQLLSRADRFLLALPGEMIDKTPVMVFADSFCISFIFTAALCFFALSSAGLPAIPAVIFFRGFEYGVFVGYLCSSEGFSGLAYFITVVFAGAFLSSLSLVYVSQFCLQCSAYLLLAIFGHSGTGSGSLRSRFCELVIHGAYSLLVTAFASLTDTVLFFMIGRFFTL